MASVFTALVGVSHQQARSIEHLLHTRCLQINSCSEFISALRTKELRFVFIDIESCPDPLNYIGSVVGRKIAVVLIVSHRNEHFIAEFLAAGADDYLVKPVKDVDLLARAYLLRRRISSDETNHVALGSCYLCLKEKSINGNDGVVKLLPKEFDLALLLFRNAGRLVSRNLIELTLWDEVPLAASRTIDTHVSMLRKKLRFVVGNEMAIRSVKTRGYMLICIENDTRLEHSPTCQNLQGNA